MKPWDEMTAEERVEWFRRHGRQITPAEVEQLVEGAAENPAAFAALERAFAQLKDAATTGTPDPARDTELKKHKRAKKPTKRGS